MRSDGDISPPSRSIALPWAARLAEALPVALVSALPTYLRTRGADPQVETAFSSFALAALLTWIPATLLMTALRRATETLRQLMGETPVAGAGMLVATATLCLFLWDHLATFLTGATHHRGLGGVAFAAGALALSVGAAMGARTARQWIEGQGSSASTFAGVAGLFAPVLLLRLTPVAAPAIDVLGLLVVDSLALLLVSSLWVLHLAPTHWPSRARVLIGCGALCLAFAASSAAANVTSENTLRAQSLVFQLLPLR